MDRAAGRAEGSRSGGHACRRWVRGRDAARAARRRSRCTSRCCTSCGSSSSTRSSSFGTRMLSHLHPPWSSSHCCVLRAACCVLRAACCVLRAACCVLRAARAARRADAVLALLHRRSDRRGPDARRARRRVQVARGPWYCVRPPDVAAPHVDLPQGRVERLWVQPRARPALRPSATAPAGAHGRRGPPPPCALPPGTCGKRFPARRRTELTDSRGGRVD